MGLKAILFTGIFLLNARARAVERPSCLPESTSLQAIASLNLSADGSGTYALKSENASGVFVTKVGLDYAYTAQTRTLNLKFHFDGTAGEVSLPYNVFAILVVQNGQPVAWYDYTQACQSLGPGLYPGQSFSPVPLKLAGSGRQPLQIMVWGRIN